MCDTMELPSNMLLTIYMQVLYVYSYGEYSLQSYAVAAKGRVPKF